MIQQDQNSDSIKSAIRKQLDMDYRSGNPRVPPHQHDGVDNIRINAKNIIPNNKFQSFLVSSNGGGTIFFGNSVTTISNSPGTGVTSAPLSVTNPTQMLFYGFAANNNGSGSTYKATINGNAQFGNCYKFSNDLVLTKESIVQCCNGMYIIPDPTTVFAVKVFADSRYLATIFEIDGTPWGNTNPVVLEVTNFDSKSITCVATLADGWILDGTIVIT